VGHAPPHAITSIYTRNYTTNADANVNGGLLTVDEACEHYNLTLEEFAAWQRAVDRSGMPGLRITRLQYYREL